jgi:hypothetical protein
MCGLVMATKFWCFRFHIALCWKPMMSFMMSSPNKQGRHDNVQGGQPHDPLTFKCHTTSTGNTS